MFAPNLRHQARIADWVLIGIVLILPIAATSCTHSIPPPDAPAALGEIYYSRRGGFVGTNDSLHITASGEVEAHGRMFGDRTGKLTDADRRALVELFRGWDRLQENYPTPRAAMDLFGFVVHYQGKTVKASDASMPGALKQILQKLEAITGGLAAK